MCYVSYDVVFMKSGLYTYILDDDMIYFVDKYIDIHLLGSGIYLHMYTDKCSFFIRLHRQRYVKYLCALS